MEISKDTTLYIETEDRIFSPINKIKSFNQKGRAISISFIFLVETQKYFSYTRFSNSEDNFIEVCLFPKINNIDENYLLEIYGFEEIPIHTTSKFPENMIFSGIVGEPPYYDSYKLDFNKNKFLLFSITFYPQIFVKE